MVVPEGWCVLEILTSLTTPYTSPFTRSLALESAREGGRVTRLLDHIWHLIAVLLQKHFDELSRGAHALFESVLANVRRSPMNVSDFVCHLPLKRVHLVSIRSSVATAATCFG